MAASATSAEHLSPDSVPGPAGSEDPAAPDPTDVEDRGDAGLTASVDLPDGPDQRGGAGETDESDGADGPGAPGRVRRGAAAIRRHPVRSSVAALVLLVVLVVGAAVAWVRMSSSPHIYAVDEVPARPVALVLGAGLRPDGTPSRYLEARLADAVELHRTGKVRAILVSGDNSRTDYDEVTAMRAWLVDHGVPAAEVVRDHAGFDTYDSCQRAKRIFGVEGAVVVTQDFHVPRAVFTCRQAGIDAVGVASSSVGGHPALNVLREVPASVKASWDAIVDPGPAALGPAEDDLDAALADP